MKKLLKVSAGVFVLLAALEFFIHGTLLKGIYQQTMSVWRPEADMKSMMWLMWLGYLVFAVTFVQIYSQGYEKNKAGAAQGVRYGVLVGILMSVMPNLIWYVVLPIPADLAWGR